MKGRKVKKKRLAIRVARMIGALILGFIVGAGYLEIRYPENITQDTSKIFVEYRPPSEEWEAEEMMKKAITGEVQSQ